MRHGLCQRKNKINFGGLDIPSCSPAQGDRVSHHCQIDWRERSASHAGEAPREFVEDTLDRLLAAMEEDE